MSAVATAAATPARTVPLSEAAGSRLGPAPGRATPYGRDRKPLGDPAPLACTVAKAAFEAVHGSDAAERLVRWVVPSLRESLAKQSSLARRGGVRRRDGARIARIRVCRISATVAEASVAVHDGDLMRAVALRLEDVQGRWVATAIDIG